MGALDHATTPALPEQVQAGLDLADRILQQAEEAGQPVSRETALLLAGQHLASVAALAPIAASPASWTNEAMEALYPPDVAPWKRTVAPLAFVLLAGTIALGGLQALGLTMDLLSTPPLTAGEWLHHGLVLGAMVGLGSACRWLMKQTAVSDEVFVERLKAVDTESLVRWYHSGQCRSYTVLYGVLRQRGVCVRP